jgi:hypothetical protein
VQIDMNWQDPEYVLPSEGEVVICQVLERNGLVKCTYSRGMWLDMNRMPIDVIKWKEIHTSKGSDPREPL